MKQKSLSFPAVVGGESTFDFYPTRSDGHQASTHRLMVDPLPAAAGDDVHKRITFSVLLICLISNLAVGPAQAESSAQSRQSYQQKAQTELNKISAKVIDLRSRFEKAGLDTRKDLDADTQVLQKKIDETRQQLDALGKTTDTQWDSFRKNLDQSLADVRRSYKTTEAHFKTKPKNP